MKNTLRVCALIAFIFTNTSLLLAQWVQTNRPTEINVLSLASSSWEIFAGTESGVYYSNNNGANWESIPTGLNYSIVSALAIRRRGSFCWDRRGHICVHFQRLRVSMEYRQLWPHNRLNQGSSREWLKSIRGNITGGGVFLSTNSGTNWNAVDSGLKNMYVSSLGVIGRDIFAGTDRGVFLSSNNGSGWTSANSGLGNLSVFSFATEGTNLFVGTSGGVFSLQ